MLTLHLSLTPCSALRTAIPKRVNHLSCGTVAIHTDHLTKFNAEATISLNRYSFLRFVADRHDELRRKISDAYVWNRRR